MKLKDIRPLFTSDCYLLIGKNTYPVDPQLDECDVDELEVRAIRSRMRLVNGYAANSIIEIILDLPKNVPNNSDQPTK